MEISNLNLSGITVTDELYTDFGASSSALTGWPAFKADGFAIYEDATPHAGSPLVLDTDYTLDNKDVRKSQELGEDVYTKITMLTHTTGDIYISYTSIGSYIDADDIRNVLDNYIITRPTAKDISAGNQTTDLSVYETGGGSAKPSGFKIKISWTGGNSTYTHAFTGTAYTIGGLAIANWVGNGTGSLTLELDNDNSDWIILDDLYHIYDTYSVTASSITRYIYRYVNRRQTVEIFDDNTRSTTSSSGSIYYYAGTTYDITAQAFATVRSVKPWLDVVSGVVWPGGCSPNLTTVQPQFIAATNGAQIKPRLLIDGTI